MQYKQKIITDNAKLLPVDVLVGDTKTESIRSSLYNLLGHTPLTAFPAKLKEYVSNLPPYTDFWTVAQIEDFMGMFYFTPERVENFITEPDNNPVLFGALETWLTSEKTKSDGKNLGICREIEEIENKITRVVNSAYAAKNTFDSIMQDLQDISTKGVIESAKKLIESIADAQIQKIMSKIENVTNLIASIHNITRSGVIQAKIIKLRDEMEDMASEENVKKLKEMISGQLGLTLSQFENIGPKEIRHLMDRACSISKNVALPFDRKAQRVDSISRYYASSGSRLTTATNETTQNAINAGAYRYSSSSIDEKRAIAAANEKAAIESQPNAMYTPEPSEEEIAGVTPWNGGRGDDKISFRGPWVTKVGAVGWSTVDIKVKTRLVRLQKMFGRPLIVNSAYRPPAYNRSVGGAKNSNHMHGLAVDITWNGFNASTKAEFIRMARLCGFGGVGVNYRTFVHIDIGGKRDF